MSTGLKDEISRATQDVIELRRDLHRHPELSFHEDRTARVVADGLKRLGLEVRTGVGKTGVVGTLRGRSGAKTVAVRADIDALPIQEENAAPYKSATPGVMHACGHDGHTAIALGVARVLSRQRETFAGAVKFIFQPAEELADGAEAMIKDGALENPRVDAILAVHLWNYLPVGVIGLRAGPLWASVDDLKITIKGRGGHGALPHQTIDPVPIAAQTILALQSLVSRESSPFQPVVLTIGQIQGGTAWNIIPGSVTLKGTLRTFDMALRDALVRRVEDVVRGVCLGMRADYELEDRFASPPVVNDPALTQLVREVSARLVGPERVVAADQSTVGDDLAFFHEKAAGCYILVGSGNKERGLDKPHHHPLFDFDEAALPTAVELLASAALEFLARP